MPNTLLRDAGFARPKSAVHGAVIVPEDPEYDEARRIWNGMVDRRPGLIVTCAIRPEA